jgi:transcriptional regulator with XRE-family HTH domain
MTTSPAFGTLLRVQRERLGLSQEELARRSGLSRVYITNLESRRKGNPTLDKLVFLARGLGLRVGELLEGL